MSDLHVSEDSGLHDLRRLAAEARRHTVERTSLPPLLAPAGPLAVAPSLNAPASRARSRGFVGPLLVAAMLGLSAVAFARVPRAPRPQTYVLTSGGEMPVARAGDVMGRWPTLPNELDERVVVPTERPSRVSVPEPTPARRTSRVPNATRRPTTPTTTPSAPSPAPARERSELDDLLDRALGAHASTATEPSLPARPSSSSVTTSLRALQNRVARCSADDTGVATVRLVFAGSTGEVQSVSWVGERPESASCIEAAVRGVEVDPFAQSTFSVTFPYRL
ncbi:MAG: hypothetical protein H6721_09060 [Sandaracinus sp.]|nr:hypothetical protein [Sandaracinus sp.]MCB9632265.1 hypothetical protein [Sandaracinus sp.]